MNNQVIPKVLVLGGTAFVSRCIAMKLIEKGYKVDILTRGIRAIDYSGYHKHIICDRHNTEALRKALQNSRYEYIFDMNAYYDDDIYKLLNIIDTNSIEKYILCSTASVYTFREGITDENGQRLSSEDNNTYGLNKKYAEDILMYSGIPYVIIRPTYIYGEYNEIPRETYIFKAIEDGTPLEICSNKNTRIHMIYIEDLGDLFISTMESKNLFGCFNACNDEIITFENYIKICEEIIGKKANILYYRSEEEPDPIAFPYVEFSVLLNNKKLIKDGLIIPKTSLRDGLRKTYQWYKKKS
ncbi:NAD-dependent epimerase/dehydratase family protein [Mobilitalea sibirica]|uniref:NAD-dependent epimerase/dehydratase family protein n=1 Tax=Mobilitalea sibirica TaxID=1462919 RepID=A0A8J7H178_9FIRM|nr:NAD-dependent epimerase/dehydratase family protein [Mobilitalea sibirica]MBH1942429.1 NAD-dependent epimerase/dehydratase family protein [Mobilitalea sibirica]